MKKFQQFILLCSLKTLKHKNHSQLILWKKSAVFMGIHECHELWIRLVPRLQRCFCRKINNWHQQWELTAIGTEVCELSLEMSGYNIISTQSYHHWLSEHCTYAGLKFGNLRSAMENKHTKIK